MAYKTSDQPDNATTKQGKGMTEDAVRSALAGMVASAKQYAKTELTERRARAIKFYKGELFGDEVPNRSHFVLTVLRDTILQMMPSFMRVLFGAERPVEFIPRTPESVVKAELATRYISDVVIRQDNRGFSEVYSWVKDALISRQGVIKWWWDDSEETRGFDLTVDGEQLTALQNDDAIDDLEVTPSKLAPRDLYDVSYTRRRNTGRARFSCLPNDEYIYMPRSRTVTGDAWTAGVSPLVGHVSDYTRSQLVALGVDDDDITMYGDLDSSAAQGSEELARRLPSDTTEPNVDDPTMKKFTYTEAYAFMDVDGDKIAELRKFCCLGPSCYVVNGDGLGEPWEERPFAVICPDPEPHVVEGQGPADWTMDLQETMSKIARTTLDSLSLSLASRFAYSEGDVNVDDLNNPDLGASIRIRQGSIPAQVIQEFKHTFGREGIEMLSWFMELKENRTGTTRAIGVDADVMQSTTKQAVAATVTAAQERIELITRVFCETGYRELMRGLLRLTVRHQDGERMMKVAGQYVPVNPSEWDPDMDVAVNVGLGGGQQEHKDAILQAALAKQEGMLQLLGPTPIVDFKRWRDTLVKWLQNAGRMDADQFFGDVPEGWQPQPQGQQGPDPNQMIAQAETIKAQSKVQSDAAKVQLDAMKAQVDQAREMKDLELRELEIRLTNERERERIEGDMALRVREMNYKYNAQVTTAQIQADVQRERSQSEIAIEEKRAENESKRRPVSKTVKVQHDAEGKVSTLEVSHDGEETA